MTAREFYSLAGKPIGQFVKPFGFKKRGRFFYRITDDGVIQQFCLLWLNRIFTVRFDLSSIYSHNGHDNEGDEIYQIIDNSNDWLSDYHSHVETLDAAAAICFESVKDILLPFFETHKDPKSAREFIVTHNLRIQGGYNKFDLREIGFYLSMGDMNACRDFLVHYIENSSKYNQIWWREVEQEYQRLLDAIVCNDTEYISDYMNNKKKETYAEYKWK
ncbi:MAG: hypothetical protein IJF56_03915 [Clostridia bacterium]|nr:hypothetical protein [Clostridia bacterium]